MNQEDNVVFSMSGTLKLILFLCFDPEPEEQLSEEQKSLNLARVNAMLDFAEQLGFTNRARMVELIPLVGRVSEADHDELRGLLREFLSIADPEKILNAGGFYFSASQVPTLH